MASSGSVSSNSRAGAAQGLLRELFSLSMLWRTWLPILIIGALHYSTGSHHHWAHDVLRRLYYVPILVAAFSLGTRGGFAAAVVVSLTYAPHAFFLEAHGHHDPESTLNKALEILLYNTIGLLAGILADREAKRRVQVERAFDEQRQMGEQLVRAGRLAALGELVAGIAHELKNPLHTIKGTAEIVDEVMPKDVEQSAMWTLMRQEIDRLERVSERFLSFARPSKLELVPVGLEDLRSRIDELLRARSKSSPGVQLHVTPIPTAVSNATVRVDRDQLTQAVLNIAGNAFAAMGDSGELRFTLELEDSGGRPRAMLRLENDGPAIEPEDLEKIFNPFYTRSEQGTGLGLPIAERIAEAHGGHILAENLPDGRGVVFSICLPCEIHSKKEG